jgi:hypothetical protein
MKSLILYSSLLIILSRSVACAQVAIHLNGTWIRYNDQEKIAEIFIILDNGDFLANEINKDNQLYNIEKGKWQVKGDTISFTFSQVISSKNQKDWISKETQPHKLFSYKFTLTENKLLQIGNNLYKRECSRSL